MCNVFVVACLSPPIVKSQVYHEEQFHHNTSHMGTWFLHYVNIINEAGDWVESLRNMEWYGSILAPWEARVQTWERLLRERSDEELEILIWE